MVKEMLRKVHNVNADDLQLSVALEMGCAITMYIDIDKLQISFLLNLPLVVPEKVYQTKHILNVGTWKEDTYVKVKSPDIIAYQPWGDGTYLVPNLQTCTGFKDINYLCPGKPFIPETAGPLCGVQNQGEGEKLCDVTVSKPDKFELNTVAILVKNQWLVSTRLTNLTVTYALHGTFQVMPIPYRVSLITVPKDMIVTIGNQVLFHVANEVIEEEIELINVFKNVDIPMDEDLDFLLKHKSNHSMQLIIRKANVSIQEHQFNYQDMELIQGRDWTAIKLYSIYICLILLMIWMFVITLAVFCRNPQGEYALRKKKYRYKGMDAEKVEDTIM